MPISSNLEIYLIRHGETVWNHHGRYQGRLDSPLTGRGIEQAQSCGALLAKCKVAVDHWHVSPLGRARQTSEIVRSFGDYPLAQSTDRLAEVSAGSWDGLTHEEIDAEWPDALDGSTQFDWYFRAPDGETYDEAMERVQSWLHGLSGVVVAVSHGLLSRLIRGRYLGLSMDQALGLSVKQGVVWRMTDGEVDTIGDN